MVLLDSMLFFLEETKIDTKINEKNLNNINLLDCTLRDGGYYNNWDFSNELVNKYLKAISKSKIKFSEIGFRSFKKILIKAPIGTLLIITLTI